MLKPIPVPPDSNLVAAPSCAKILRDYADYIEAEGSAVAIACFIMTDDGIAQSWVRGYDGSHVRLGEILIDAGDDLTDGTYGVDDAKVRREH